MMFSGTIIGFLIGCMNKGIAKRNAFISEQMLIVF